MTKNKRNQKSARRIIALMTAILLTVSQGVPMYAASGQQAANKPAVTADSTLTRLQARDIIFAAASKYNNKLKPSDILSGYTDGSSNDGQLVTRLETMIMISRAFGNLPEPGNRTLRGSTDARYTDVPVWAAASFEKLYAARLQAVPEDGLLRGGDLVTAEELDKLLRRVYALYGTHPEDDFYDYVNKAWLEIEPRSDIDIDAYMEVQTITDAQVAKLVDEIVYGKWEKGTIEQKIADFYETLTNAEARKKDGMAPLKPYLTMLDDAKTVKEIDAALVKIGEATGVMLSVGFYPCSDYYDVRKSAIELKLSLANAVGVSSASSAERAGDMERLFKSAGDANPNASAASAVEIEKKLANAITSVRGNGCKIMTVGELQKILPSANVKEFFRGSGLKEASFYISDAEKAGLQALAKYYTDGNAGKLKAFAKLELLLHFADSFSVETAETAGSGVDENGKPIMLDEYAKKRVTEYFSDYISYVYAKRFFSKEEEAEISGIIDDLVGYYEKRITDLYWMGDATKAEAIKKLDTLKVQLGGPTESEYGWLTEMDINSYADGGSVFKNMAAFNKAVRGRGALSQGQPTDLTKWSFMDSYSVNSAYVPPYNMLTLPAGILQEPFYKYGAPIEKNMGGIGVILGHEITHAFDINGSQYDENGERLDWWTAEDKAAFKTLNALVIAHYDGYEIAPGIAVNGALTLMENTADLGGMSAAIGVLKARKSNPDYRMFFSAAAVVEKNAWPRGSLKWIVEHDVHSPGKARINLRVSTFQEFYDAFGVKPGDGMYVRPEKRVKIW